MAEHEAKVATEIARLLNHYWTKDDNPAVRAALSLDWLNDLVEFSPETVAEACTQWRRAHRWRPTIADIRALCMPTLVEHHHVPHVEPSAPESPEELAERIRVRQWRGMTFEAWSKLLRNEIDRATFDAIVADYDQRCARGEEIPKAPT